MLRKITSTSNWKSFCNLTLNLTKFEKGLLFEILTYQVLKNHYKYSSLLKNVWLLRENNVPFEVKKYLNLTNSDEGIDIVAETFKGEFWAIQCKFKSKNSPPTVKELSTFTNLSYNYCKNFSYAILFHTGDRGVRKKHLLGDKYLEIGLEFWHEIKDNEWEYIVKNGILNEKIKFNKRSPRSHQSDAIQASIKYFIKEKNKRGKLIMPCGTGKSLTAFWIADALNSKSTIIAVPSLALIKQALEDWIKEIVISKKNGLPDWLCICSDQSTTKLDDSFVVDTNTLGIPTTTNENDIVKFLNLKSPFGKIIFTTYQSADKLALATKILKFKFDLAILDEAHKTVGSEEKSFSGLLKDDFINISKRIFMTATERIVKGSDEKIISMDNETIFGKRFYQLTFKEAINKKLITDYKIITVFVNDFEIKDLINKRKILRDKDKSIEADAQMLTSAIALNKAIQQFNLSHIVSFHRSIAASLEFKDIFSKINLLEDKHIVLQISSKLNAGKRAELLNDFKNLPKSIITNSRCLTEGVDVPAIDCVLFADQKNSVVDIVQASGRALRHYSDGFTGYKKELGYIIIPVVLNESDSLEDLSNSNRFKTITRVVSSLSTQDETIAEELKILNKNTNTRGDEKIVFIGGGNKVIDLDSSTFKNQIITKIWEKVSKLNWTPFNESRAFTNALGLKSVSEWRNYCVSGNKPFDIPSKPNNIYINEWNGWNDWLGTENQNNWEIAKKRFSYIEAKEFLKYNCNGLINSMSKFNKWKNGKLKIQNIPIFPDKMPGNPINTYGRSNEWISNYDFFGKEVPLKKKFERTNYFEFEKIDYEELKNLIKNEGLNNRKEYQDWHSKNNDTLKKKGKYAPVKCESYSEFEGWTIFLNSNHLPSISRSLKGKWKNYTEAKKIVKRLNISKKDEWYEFINDNQNTQFLIQNKIPRNPSNVYKNKGWESWADWLGKN